MDNTAIQGAIWLFAGAAMYLFLRRRRARKNTR